MYVLFGGRRPGIGALVKLTRSMAAELAPQEIPLYHAIWLKGPIDLRDGEQYQLAKSCVHMEAYAAAICPPAVSLP
jgi:hypothetical protein